jgi:hypothetical protein
LQYKQIEKVPSGTTLIIAQQFIAGKWSGKKEVSPVGTTEHADAISVVPMGLNPVYCSAPQP